MEQTTSDAGTGTKTARAVSCRVCYKVPADGRPHGAQIISPCQLSLACFASEADVSST